MWRLYLGGMSIFYKCRIDLKQFSLLIVHLYMWGHPDFRLDQWCLAHLAFLFIMCKFWGKNRNCNWLWKLIMVSLYSVLPFNLPSFSLLSCRGTVCNGHLFFWAGCWISGFLKLSLFPVPRSSQPPAGGWRSHGRAGPVREMYDFIWGVEQVWK